jgi:hypothetical protein
MRDIPPKPLLSLHHKGQLAGCSLGYRLYFCVSKPSSGRRLHEEETGSRLTNGSFAMSLNSYHVVLNTMPNAEAQRWQIIGMHTTGMSFKAIGRQMGYHYIVVSRPVRKHTQTNNVKDLPRSSRPRVTSDRDDRALQHLVRRMPFATSPVLKQHWLPNRHLSTRTVRNRLNR